MLRPGELPGGLGVRILGFHCRGLGLVPGQGTEILQATRRSMVWHGQKKKKKVKTCIQRLEGRAPG